MSRVNAFNPELELAPGNPPGFPDSDDPADYWEGEQPPDPD